MARPGCFLFRTCFPALAFAAALLLNGAAAVRAADDALFHERLDTNNQVRAENELADEAKGRGADDVKNWLLEGAKLDSTLAQEGLARWYQGEWGGTVDDAEALYWYSLAEEKLDAYHDKIVALKAKLSLAQIAAARERVLYSQPWHDETKPPPAEPGTPKSPALVVGLAELLEFGEQGAKAGLVGTSGDTNGYATSVITFANTSDPAFYACLPLLLRGLPQGKQLYLDGDGEAQLYGPAYARNFRVYVFTKLEHCQAQDSDISYGEHDILLRSTPPARTNFTLDAKALYHKYLKQGAVLAEVQDFSAPAGKPARLRAYGEDAYINNGLEGVQNARRVDITFTKPQDQLLQSCRQYFGAGGIPKGAKLRIFGYGIGDDGLLGQEGSQLLRSATIEMNTLTECTLIHDGEVAGTPPAPTELRDEPGYVLYLKTSPAVFWLRYNVARPDTARHRREGLGLPAHDKPGRFGREAGERPGIRASCLDQAYERRPAARPSAKAGGLP